MNTTQGDQAQAANVDAHSFQRERAFQHLQKVFEGKVEADVIRHVLSQSQWKVGDALKTLQNVVTSFDGREAVPEPMKSPAAMDHGQYVQSVMHSNTRHHHLSLKLTSKIPLTSDDTAALPMLSPKTPFFGELEYPPFTTGLVQDPNIVQAMEALQLYAQQPDVQMPPTPDVYILQHSQIAGGGNNAQVVSLDAQAPHPLTMQPQHMMPVSSPLMSVTSPMMPVSSPLMSVTSPMMPVSSPTMPVSSPDSYISAEPTYASQMQCALLQSPDGTIIPEAQFSGSYPMDKNASFYPSADPFRATQNLYDAQHSDGKVLAGWFVPSSESSETQYVAVSEAEQTNAGQDVSTGATDVNKAHRPSKKVFRTKAYSLNPEEREALENLIEDVIIGGVDNEVMTSDESDSDCDDESGVVQSESKEGNRSKDNASSDGLPKVYPAQLKVAVKHMKNLPPRFLKKIHAAPKTVGGDGVELAFEAKRLEEREELRMVAEREKTSKMEGQKRDIKKKIRNMLDGLDSYVEEHVVLVDEDCCKTNDNVVTSEPSEEVPVSAPPPATDIESTGGRKVPTGSSSPMLGMSAQRIVLKPNVINCSDLERELLGESHAEKRSTFSVDAPEFVPRAFTPISHPPPSCVSLAQGVCPPVTTSPYRGCVTGHNSPQSFGSQLHLTRTPLNGPIPHSSPAAPAYMIPKVTYPVSTPATVVGMRFQQYPTPTYNVAAMPQFNPILQPSFVPPGFGIQDLGANRAGQGMYPLYVAPQCKPVNPYISHLSPRSSPKAVRRVIDPNVLCGIGMQSILIPRPMPHLSPNSNARPGDPSYNPLYTANVYRHLSPHSSPKVHRRGAADNNGALKHKILELISSGKKVMIILRGLPGCGKSTLARELQGSGVVLSTDNFFMNNGKYEIDFSKLSEAHEWNRQKAMEAVEAAVNPVIIDNTNVQSWEMKPYVALALKYSYHVEFVEPPTQWRHTPSELAEKNIHHVTVESLRKMLDYYEHSVTVESIMRPVASPHTAKSAVKDDPDLPLSEDATDTAQGKKLGRRRKRKRRKRKRKTAEEDKANEGESSDEDSAAEGDEVVVAEAGSASEVSHKCDSAEGKDQQGNLQCPPCCRQGGHITSLAALAKAQFERQLQTKADDNLLAEQQDIPQHASVDIVSQALLPLVGQSADAQVTHAFSLSEDTDILLKACSEALMQRVASMQLDKNGNNAQEEDDVGRLSLMDDNIMQCEHLRVLDSDSRNNVEALVDENVMQSEQLMMLGGDSRKTVMFSLEAQQGVSDGRIQAQSSDNRQPASDDSCEMPEGQTEMLLRDKNVLNADVDSCASGTAADLGDDGEVTEITTSSSFSRLSQEVLGPMCPVPDSHADAVSQEGNGSDEDKGGSESTVEMLQDLCSAAKTDDEKWTERCEKCETRPLKAAMVDRAGRPKPRRRQNLEEKINILTAVDQLDLGDLTSWKSLTEVMSAPVTPVARGNPGFHRFVSCDPTSSELEKFPSVPSGGVVLLEEEAVLLEEEAVLREEEAVLPVPDECVKDVETYTCPADFALLQKIVHSKPASWDSVRGQHVLCCSARVISDNLPSPRPPVSHHTRIVTLDKGCTTDDLLVAPPADGVGYLHCWFPEVSLDDLSYMLNTCGGDIEWAANILLDTGHEYRVDNGGDANTSNVEKSTDVANESERSVDGGKCWRQLQSNSIGALPPPDDVALPSLFCLCYADLTPSVLGSLQERISDSDMARLLAIRHFNESHTTIANLTNGDDKLAVESVGDRDVQNQCTSSTQDVSSEVTTQVEGSLVFQLSDTLAAQLIHLFGPVDVNMSNGLADDALLVRLDTEMARRLHELWGYSVAHRKSAVLQDTLLTDEELARRLQEEEDRVTPHSPPKHPGSPYKHSGSPQRRSHCVSVQHLEQVVSERVDERRESEGGEMRRRPDSPPASLKEIMEEEEALQLSRKEYEALQSAASDEQAISTKLKRQKLLEMFPYVDPTVLVDVFKSSQYHLETTSGIIQELFNPPGCPTVDLSSVFQGSTLTEEQLLTWSDELDGQTASKRSQDKYCDEDFRSDAAMHYRLRLECFEKARDAYRRRMMGVAAFYSQQGHVHTQKMKAANEAAAQEILQHRNPRLSQARCVDLHGLHVTEAIHTLEQILTDRERGNYWRTLCHFPTELCYQPDKRKRHLLVMTGKGNHSHRGIARIRLAVIDYLKKNNYRYSESHPGLIKILLKYRGVE